MDQLFYKKAADYWSNIPPTLEGVLGGFGFISEVDITGSKAFLDDIFSLNKPPSKNIALDCGAGIGRITKDLLISFFEKVDMIDQNENFLKVAKDIIEPQSKLGDLYPVGLQDFQFKKKYDVIWSQWVLGHLTDKDFISFFTMCRNYLAVNGIIIVKENTTSSGELEKDEIDSSVTRSHKHLLALFKKSNLKIIKQHKQTDFPKGLYPVYIFALRPSDANIDSNEKVHTTNSDSIQTTNKETNSNDQFDKLSKEIGNLNINHKSE